MDEKLEALLREAFLLGLRCARDGFNGECLYDHLAPSDPFDGHGAYDEENWAALVAESSEIEAMWEFAKARLERRP
jgi:hypothetical protein